MSASKLPIIVRATLPDAAALSAIAWAAKAFWGYPPEWMEEWREHLTITPDFIAQNEVFMAVIGQQLAGFHALLPTPKGLRLEHLWVRPERIGEGIGRALFQHAAGLAAAGGAASLTIEADPHAESFYRHMGARRAGSTASEVGGLRRELPLLIFDLTKSARLPPEGRASARPVSPIPLP